MSKKNDDDDLIQQMFRERAERERMKQKKTTVRPKSPVNLDTAKPVRCEKTYIRAEKLTQLQFEPPATEQKKRASSPRRRRSLSPISPKRSYSPQSSASPKPNSPRLHAKRKAVAELQSGVRARAARDIYVDYYRQVFDDHESPAKLIYEVFNLLPTTPRTDPLQRQPIPAQNARDCPDHRSWMFQKQHHICFPLTQKYFKDLAFLEKSQKQTTVRIEAWKK